MVHPEDEPQITSLLRELQEICEKVDEDIQDAARQLRRIVYRLRQPNLPDGAYGLPFHIYQVENGEHTVLVSLNGNIQMAQAAFDALIKIYPYREWELRWGMMTPRRHVPEPGLRREPLDGTMTEEPDISRYVLAGSPTRCSLPTCQAVFDGKCYRGEDYYYYCDADCAHAAVRLDRTHVVALKMRAR